MSEMTIGGSAARRTPGTFPAILRKDDWWAVLFGLGLIAIGCLALAGGPRLAWLAVLPAKWSRFDQLGADLAATWPRYLAQGAMWLVVASTALRALGYRLAHVVPAVLFLYLVSVLVVAIGQWDQAVRYNLEPPLVALAIGLLLANFGVLPRSLDAGFRVEFYIKLGVVLLGATLPLSLIVWAGPVAFLQASIVSIVTFLVIFFVARALGLDPRFAATLGVGGAVCGVSAAIAIAAAVGARKSDAAVVISIVILWAIVMIFALPFASARAAPAGRRRRRLDRHLGIRRRRGLCRRAGLWRHRRQGAGRRRQRRRAGGRHLHPDEGGGPRRVDRPVGDRPVDRRHHPLG